jgi:hypothetical protein
VRVIPERITLRIGYAHFWCPYCKKLWERGGHKEGFVKVAATRHVYTCYEAKLYLAGYTSIPRPSPRANELVPLAEAPRDWLRKLGAVRKRARELSLPRAATPDPTDQENR